MAKWTLQVGRELNLPAPQAPIQPVGQIADNRQEWTKGTCPNCGYTHADVGSDGVLWCPACGYSRKGCYT